MCASHISFSGERKITDRVRVWHAVDQGTREYNEDRHIIRRVFVPQLSAHVLLVAVMDGHGGAEMVELMHRHLGNLFSSNLRVCVREFVDTRGGSADSHACMDHVVPLVFSELCKRLNDYATQDQSGSTLTAAVILLDDDGTSDSNRRRGMRVWTANVGDSGIAGKLAVSCRTKSENKVGSLRDYLQLTHPHTVNNDDEKKRVEKLQNNNASADGDIMWIESSYMNVCHAEEPCADPSTDSYTVRVCSSLAMTRSIGDPQFHPYNIEAPDVLGYREPFTFLVLASDGLWDLMSAADACEWIDKYRQSGAENPAEALMTQLRSMHELHDNTTIVFVSLDDAQV